ncbi:MAG: MFS transporter [Pseudomonadota bacterium]|nr:MFS transporter [Pseudomonadota bacterium]
MTKLSAALRTQIPIYGAGIFSNSNVTIASMIVPLWALYLDITPATIGVILGIRHLPGLLFAIHGGVLLDRLGARPVMIVFAAVSVVVPLLFPIFPWVWTILVLQMVWGFATTMTWMGAQTSVSQLMRGSTRHAARLSVSVRLGMIFGPPIAGLAWDIWGPWGGFAAISVWALGLLVSCLYIPTFDNGGLSPQRRFRAGDLIPRSTDYIGVLQMMTVPAIAICVYLSATRIASYGIQESFYIVYLETLGLSKANIGLLAGTGHSVLGAIGALLLSLSPRIHSMKTELYLFLVTLFVAVILISITPLMTHFWPLFAAIALRGLLLGVNQPLMISTMARAAPKDGQGKMVGLRTTANRAASTIVPIAMGGLVEIIGLEESFYVLGGLMVTACFGIWVFMLRSLSRGQIPD